MHLSIKTSIFSEDILGNVTQQNFTHPKCVWKKKTKQTISLHKLFNLKLFQPVVELWEAKVGDPQDMANDWSGTLQPFQVMKQMNYPNANSHFAPENRSFAPFLLLLL